MGYKTKAESMAETVVGQYNALGTSRDTSWATTDAAFRVGIGTSENDREDALTVYKDGRVAMGHTTVYKDGRVAMGYQTTASGSESTATGYKTTASGSTSIAMCASTTASGSSSTAMGYKTTASGSDSTAMGSMTTASGGKSTAMGYKTKAESMAETVVGQYNALGTSRDTSWATTDAAFRVGIGTSENDRKDALTVYKDGTVAISGDLRVSGSISSNQGRRLAALEASAAKQQQAMEQKVAALEAAVAALTLRLGGE